MADAEFAGRNVLVTGAASGIGLAVARELALRGAAVAMSDRDGEGLARASRGIAGARTLVADLADPRAVIDLAASAGDIDILINNAGVQHVSPIESFDPERWETLLAVMLTAPFLLIRGLIPGMYQRGWGRVVNVASVHGLIASPFKSAYVSAKHGLVGLTKAVALEAATHEGDVTCNAVCPSYVRTPLVEQQIADQASAHRIDPEAVLDTVLLTRNAVRRLIEPEEVARAVAFLCGVDSWSMTGSALTLDAGWLAH